MISTSVDHYFAFYQKLPLKFLNFVGIKNHSMNFFYTWPPTRLIHISRNSGVSNKLKYFKAANFQRQLRKILVLFSLMLFVVFPRHAKISRATTITINVVVVLARDILAPFGNLPKNNRAFYEFMICRNVQ